MKGMRQIGIFILLFFSFDRKKLSGEKCFCKIVLFLESFCKS